MRTFFIAALLVSAPLAAAAQETRSTQVMYVAPGPDYLLSIGVAQPAGGERTTIASRMELAPDCTWAEASAITVPSDEIIAMRDPATVGGAERYGVLYATTYSALVAYQGGRPTPAYHGCIREKLTQRAASQ